MDEQFWLMLAAKMLTTAAIVVVASLLIERSGPLLGTLLATLPISAGPAYVFLAVEHGPAFIQASALASLPANAATALFILTYAALADRGQGVAVSLASAVASWGVTIGVVGARAWSLPALLVLNIVVYAGGSVLAVRFVRGHKVPGSIRRWWNIPVRVLTVVLLVGAVVIAGHALGPAAAGVAALAPVVLTSLVLILHPHIGGPATASVLATGLPGLFGFVLALTAVYLLVLPYGSAVALSSALAISLAWNVSVLLLWRSSTLSAQKRDASLVQRNSPEN